jgi:hypothetical protein
MFPANSGAKQRFKIPEIVQNGRELSGRMPAEQLCWAGRIAIEEALQR